MAMVILNFLFPEMIMNFSYSHVVQVLWAHTNFTISMNCNRWHVMIIKLSLLGSYLDLRTFLGYTRNLGKLGNRFLEVSNMLCLENFSR
jgi:hypothetical protein